MKEPRLPDILAALAPFEEAAERTYDPRTWCLAAIQGLQLLGLTKADIRRLADLAKDLRAVQAWRPLEREDVL